MWKLYAWHIPPTKQKWLQLRCIHKLEEINYIHFFGWSYHTRFFPLMMVWISNGYTIWTKHMKIRTRLYLKERFSKVFVSFHWNLTCVPRLTLQKSKYNSCQTRPRTSTEALVNPTLQAVSFLTSFVGMPREKPPRIYFSVHLEVIDTLYNVN